MYTQEGNAPAAVLTLSVEVATCADLSHEWPVQMGCIRLRRSEITFDGEAKAVEQLRFINLSGRALTLQCEESFLPECLSFRTEPEVVEDGAEGVIVISYDPSLPDARESMHVILKGLGILFLLGRFLEVADTLANAAADLGQFTGPENNNDNDQDNNQFRHSESEHGDTS